MSDVSLVDLFSLQGKVALITGGSRGLGLHAATTLLLAGASTLFLSARKADGPQGIDQAVERLNALSASRGLRGRAIGIPCDVGDVDSVAELVAEVQRQSPSSNLDILVANAGATWGGPFEASPDWSSRKILDVNVRGVFNLIRLATPLLAAAGRPHDPARVIIVASTAATNVHHTGAHGTIMYSASKAAAVHLGRNLAVELGPRHITCNTISPGFFPSKLANGLIEILGGADELIRDNPRGRLGEADDIAGVVVFLASRAGNYVNGEYISLDGGQRLTAGRQSKL